MRRLLVSFCTAIICLPGGGQAEDYAIRAGDIPLDAAAARALIDGRTLSYFDGGQSMFSVGGAYSYTYANGGGTAFGIFAVQPDGRVCIDYRNGFSRCDRYAHSRGRVVMLTENGERFPIRQ